MTKQLLAISVACVVGVVCAANVFAQDTEKLSVGKQLDLILKNQKDIQQKLGNIESRQMGIINTIIRMRAQNPTAAPQARAARPTIDPNTVYKIPIGHSPVQGKKNAKVTLVEFSEVQCPYSRRFHPVIEQVLKEYPNDIKHIFKHFPLGFHPQARPGAKAILAAGEQGKYFEMLDLLFAKGPLSRIQGESQEDLMKRLEKRYKEFAKELGLNVKKFMKDYKEKDAEWEKIINEDMALAKKINVRGTPTFFLNGRNTRARDLNSFKAEIDRILKGDDNPVPKKEAGVGMPSQGCGN